VDSRIRLEPLTEQYDRGAGRSRYRTEAVEGYLGGRDDDAAQRGEQR
jgi:hypothetical protein